jgi:hypothetical protein
MPRQKTPDTYDDKPFEPLFLLTIRADGADLIAGRCTGSMYERIIAALVSGTPFLDLRDGGGGGANVVVRSASVTSVVLREKAPVRGSSLALFDMLNGVTYFDYEDGSSTDDAKDP